MLDLLNALSEGDVSRAVLVRAAEAFPTPVRTLDAIHLATVVLASRSRDSGGPRLTVATHDPELGLAARALGHATMGC